MDDDKGTSLVFVNTSKGKSMMDHLADKVICKELDINQAVKYNSAAIKSVQCNPNRDLFFRELNRVPFEQLINKHCMDSITTRIRKKVVSLAFKVLKRTRLLKLVKRLLKSILTCINANNS